MRGKFKFQKTISICLSILLLFSTTIISTSAADAEYGPYDYDSIAQPMEPSKLIDSATMAPIEKMFYNALNKVANALLKVVCTLYPNPGDWKDISEYDPANFTPGRETYATEAAEGNVWRLGYGSESIIPTDFAAGKYYIGRDMSKRLAQGINDDNRVRAIALDDNSGEGIVVFAAVDSMGITSADTLAVRALVSDWAKEQGIQIAALNLSATHSHSALDAQGISTEFAHKVLTAPIRNLLEIKADRKLTNANNFKKYYIEQAAKAIKSAITDMREGELYYASIASGDYTKDKRGLIKSENMPPIAMLKFVPADGSKGVYVADISCHPTTFKASNGLLSSDYIYYLEQRIKEKTGYRFLFMQGSSGQISSTRTNLDTSKLPEDEVLGASTRYVGRLFADLLLSADNGEMEKLDPVLNAKYTSFTYEPTNYILLLAVKARLVNNDIYKSGDSANDIAIVMEEGYVELGNRVGFGIFPVELYPEVFFGADIIQNVSWDGTEWTYPVPADLAPEGVDMFPLPLMNDSLGYCVLDNNYAFLGHILGDNIADETLSLGKNTASTVVTEFEKLMKGIG